MKWTYLLIFEFSDDIRSAADVTGDLKRVFDLFDGSSEEDISVHYETRGSWLWLHLIINNTHTTNEKN